MFPFPAWYGVWCFFISPNEFCWIYSWSLYPTDGHGGQPVFLVIVKNLVSVTWTEITGGVLRLMHFKHFSPHIISFGRSRDLSQRQCTNWGTDASNDQLSSQIYLIWPSLYLPFWHNHNKFWEEAIVKPASCWGADIILNRPNRLSDNWY